MVVKKIKEKEKMINISFNNFNFKIIEIFAI